MLTNFHKHPNWHAFPDIFVFFESTTHHRESTTYSVKKTLDSELFHCLHHTPVNYCKHWTNNIKPIFCFSSTHSKYELIPTSFRIAPTVIFTRAGRAKRPTRSVGPTRAFVRPSIGQRDVRMKGTCRGPPVCVVPTDSDSDRCVVYTRIIGSWLTRCDG